MKIPEDKGWIKLHRQIQDNDFWLKERFTWAQAWIDLLLLANHKENSFWIRGIEIKVKRGEIAYSMVSLAKRWKWTPKTVASFYQALTKRKMVLSKMDNKTTFIQICNYGKYQQQTTEQTTEQSPSRLPSKLPTNNNDKNVNNEKNITKVIQPVAENAEYGKKEINDLLLAIKNKIGISDFVDSQQWSRIYGSHLVNLKKKLTQEKGISEFGRRLDFILNDDFKRKNCNSIKFIYNQIKGWIEPVIPQEKKSLTRPHEIDGKLYEYADVLQWRKEGRLKIIDGKEHFTRVIS